MKREKESRKIMKTTEIRRMFKDGRYVSIIMTSNAISRNLLSFSFSVHKSTIKINIWLQKQSQPFVVDVNKTWTRKEGR